MASSIKVKTIITTLKLKYITDKEGITIDIVNWHSQEIVPLPNWELRPRNIPDLQCLKKGNQGWDRGKMFYRVDAMAGVPPQSTN